MTTLINRLKKEYFTPPHRPTVAVDFDGTIAEARHDHELSRTRPRPGAREALEQFRAANFQIIVWTGRPDLADVEAWLHQEQIPYDAINHNPDYESGSRKIIADVYLDDRNVLVQDRAWEEVALDVLLTLQGKARQPIGREAGYQELLALAAQGLPELHALLSTLGYRTINFDDLGLGDLEVQLQQPGGISIIGPLKTEARATEKVEADYDGDWRRLLDIVRAAVAVDSLQKLYAAVEQAKGGGAVYARYPKDRFKEPLANGYRDYLCNYRLPCGLIVEVQYHLKPVLIARERVRMAYDVSRAIKASMEEEGRADMTPAEAEACRRARAGSEQLFAQAWEEAQSEEHGASPVKGLLTRLRKEVGRWITLDPSGTHVFIDGGKVTAGPAAMTGKPLSRLSSGSSPKQPAASKPDSKLPQQESTATAAAGFGNSKAPVRYLSEEQAKYAKQLAAKFLGSSGAVNDLPSLVGAPDDAEVELGVGRNVLMVDTKHKDFYSERFVGKDEEGKLFIKNHSFIVKAEEQRKGLGAEVFGKQVENAIQHGVAYISCHAAQGPALNGYYTWPRFGYDQPIEAFKDTAASGEHDADVVRTQLAMYHKIKEDFPTANSVLDVMATPAGREWWKKNGTDLYHAKFDLSEGSRSRKIFESYLAERQAKKGEKQCRSKSVEKKSSCLKSRSNGLRPLNSAGLRPTSTRLRTTLSDRQGLGRAALGTMLVLPL